MLKRVNDWFWAFVSLLGSNWITLLGATLTTISVLLIFAFVLLGVLGVADSPYVGILAFLVLPGVFLFGLVLIPVGLYWERRRAQKAGEVAPARAEAYPKIDFNKPRVRHLATVVGVLTVVNLLIISIVSYQGVVYMDTVEFCGQVCHTVMEPEHKIGRAHV